MRLYSGSEIASVAMLCGLVATQGRLELVTTLSLGLHGSELNLVPTGRPSLTSPKHPNQGF